MNGEWGMANGEWRMGNGEWGMGNGEWGMANGEWPMATSHFSLPTSHFPLPTSHFPLPTCHFSLPGYLHRPPIGHVRSVAVECRHGPAKDHMSCQGHPPREQGVVGNPVTAEQQRLKP